MKLSTETLSILKYFSSINSNLVIKPGNIIATMGQSHNIIGTYKSVETFDKQLSIFNLNEFLAVINAFTDPELTLNDKSVTIEEDNQRVVYNYADESLLTQAKSLQMPQADVSFDLTFDNLSNLEKMASILKSPDLSFVGNGKEIVAKVYDSKNPSSNQYSIDLGVPTSENFSVDFKMERFNLIATDYMVEFSKKKVSKFTAKATNLEVFIAVEKTTVF